MANYVLLIFGISLGISFLLTPWMRNIALKTGILSKPSRRMVHTESIPYLGGLAIYFAFVITITIAFYANQQFRIEFLEKFKGLLIGSTLIVILGLWDDLKNIRPIVKLIGQIVVALLLFAYGFRIEVLTNPFFGGEMHLPLFLSILITIAWIVGLINAINLIDGLDGLAAGIVFISGLCLLFVGLYLGTPVTVILFSVLCGSALGFLYYNFPPAKIFLGDAGSMFLGLILAVTALVGLQHKVVTTAALLIPICVITIPIYDTLLAIWRRWLKKGSVFVADKKHLHHRFLQLGLTQRQVVIAFYLATVYFGIIAFLFVLIPKEYALLLLFLLGIGLLFGVRTVGFIERKIKMMHILEKRLKKK